MTVGRESGEANGSAAGDYRAFRIHRDAAPFRAGLERLVRAGPAHGEVTVDVRHSSVNYKDALAGTNRGRILRTPSLVGGIDLAGTVRESACAGFAPGDEVFVCGAGLSETLDGGYAEFARLPGSLLLRPPAGLGLRDCMAIGTAGITAAIALRRLEDAGQPKDRGPIVVTGASGGVGGFAVHLLAGAGYEVCASTGKADSHDYLRELGAHSVVGREAVGGGGAPRALEPGRWGGAVDSVGGDTLAWLLATVRPWGNVASIGLAGGDAFASSVMPFIIRGASVLGINCIELPRPMLEDCWARLGGPWRPTLLGRIAPHAATLDTLPAAFEALLGGRITGRTVVDVAAAGSADAVDAVDAAGIG